MIEDHGGQTAVFLSKDGDHIAVRFLSDVAGYQREITLPADSMAWDKAVRRAQIGLPFMCGVALRWTGADTGSGQNKR